MRANIAEKSKCCSALQHSVEKMMVASHEVNAQFTPRKPDFTPIVRQNWRLGNCSNAASACRARERFRIAPQGPTNPKANPIRLRKSQSNAAPNAGFPVDGYT